MSKTKSKITSDQVAYVGSLASLSLTSEQVKTFKPQLNDVLTYVSQLQSLDTSKTPETTQVTNLKNVFREDIIEKDRLLTQEEALSNAKKTHQGYFLVPYILK